MKQEDINEIWLPNLVDKYVEQPLDAEFTAMCLAKFASEYRFISNSSTNNEQINEMENPSIILDKDLEIAKKHTKKCGIIRYQRIRIQKDMEKYHAIMFLYLPFTTKNFKPNTFHTFEDCFLNGSYGDTPVHEVVKTNMLQHDPLAKDIDNSWEQLQSNTNQGNAWTSLFPQAEKERLEDAIEIENQTIGVDPEEQQAPVVELQPHNNDNDNREK